MRRKEAHRQADQPPRAIERTDRLPTGATTRANPPGERSPAAQRRTSPSEAQAEAGRTALGALLGDKASAEEGYGSLPAVRSTSKGQEQPRLERSARALAPRCEDVASAFGAVPEESDAGGADTRTCAASEERRWSLILLSASRRRPCSRWRIYLARAYSPPTFPPKFTVRWVPPSVGYCTDDQHPGSGAL